jgi:hypothetical protein
VHEELVGQPPQLDPGETPFERPRRFARPGPFVLHARRRSEKPLSETSVAIFLAIYALGLYGVGFFDSGLLLLSGLMTGPLVITIYLNLDGRGSLLNPYTLFFAALVLGSLAGHVGGLSTSFSVRGDAPAAASRSPL